MSFLEPLWLFALAAVLILFWVHRRGIGVVSARQRQFGLGVRILVTVALILALAGTSLSLPDPTLATVFVLDRSDSVSATELENAEDFVRNAIASKRSEDLAGVVVAGREARVELSVQQNPELTRVASAPDASRTDLSRALRLAAAILPEGTRRRIVLLTDGRENSGDLRSEARRLRKLGIRLDTVSLESSLGPDVAIVSFEGPSHARAGDELELTMKVSASTQMRGATVKIAVEGRSLLDSAVDLNEGENRFNIVTSVAQAGAHTFSATVHHDKDSVPQNNTASAMTIVAGPPSVVIIEGEEGEGSDLVKALGDRGINASVRGVTSFPAPAELAAIDAMVLVDVDANTIGTVEQNLLRSFVQDLGHGLVAVGGESSWSLGNYADSVLEEVLPVSSEIQDPERRPSVSQILVMDASGSMSGQKIEIGRSGALFASRALRKGDHLGILAFTTTSQWILELQKLPGEDKVRSALGRLQANGGTEIPQALNTAADRIANADTALKHIILFSDGFSGGGDMIAAAQNVKRRGGTLSVVGTGESAEDVLKQISIAGGGRFYPGRDLKSIPRILHDETLLASRRFVNEGVFRPKIAGLSAVTERLNESPALLGYIGTSLKTSASNLLTVGDYDDPLLATWRTGLGIATAWTSDAKARWSVNWIKWDGFADFWSNLVRETFPAPGTPGFSTRALANSEGFGIVVDSEQVLPEGTTGIARIVGPSGTSQRVELARSGLNQLAGTGLVGDAGAYLVSVELQAGGRRIYGTSVGAVRTYSPEYHPTPANPALLKEAARVAGGRLDIKPKDAFRRDIPIGTRRIDVSKWLLLFVLLLLPIDIALRRLTFSKQDFRLALQRRHLTEQPKLTQSLLKAKQRVAARYARPDTHGEGVAPASPRTPRLGPDPHEAGPISQTGRSSDDAQTQPPREDRGEEDDTLSELLRAKRRRQSR